MLRTKQFDLFESLIARKTSKMKKILIPTDFSQVADNALAYAIELGAAFQSELLLYHVYHISKVDYNRDFSPDEQPFRKQIERKMELSRLKFGAQVTENGLSLETKVRREPIMALFDRKVEEHNINVIVMGSKGASGLKKVIFGSVAAIALNMAKIPVFIIPPESFSFPIRNIVLAIDDQVIAKATLEPLQRLASAFGAKVTVVNVKSNTTPATVPRITLSMGELEINYLELPPTSSINDTLNAFTNQTGCDLLCMIRRERGFFERLFQGSTTINQAYDSQKPLLVLPDLS